MADTVYFPGSFNPPTFGHLEVLRQACEVFPEVVVVCSENPNKAELIPAHIRINLWRSYDLPENSRVITLDQALRDIIPGEPKIMLRGLRSEEDIEDEMAVMKKNHRDFDFSNFFYIFTAPEFADISSSRCWQLAKNGDLAGELKGMVNPFVERYLIDLLWVGPSLSGLHDDWE